jgi:multicomponent Na+:H+ antiporter subunit E
MKPPTTNRITGAVAVVSLWLLLMGEVTAGNIVAGAVVAVFALVLFPHPTRGRHRLSVWGIVRLLADLAVQLVISSARVALAVIAPTPARVRTSVVSVPLHTDSELVATVVADLITLTPGTLTLDVQQGPPRLLVHVLGASEPASVVESVGQLERRVLHAVRPEGGGARSDEPGDTS